MIMGLNGPTAMALQTKVPSVVPRKVSCACVFVCAHACMSVCQRACGCVCVRVWRGLSVRRCVCACAHGWAHGCRCVCVCGGGGRGGFSVLTWCAARAARAFFSSMSSRFRSLASSFSETERGREGEGERDMCRKQESSHNTQQCSPGVLQERLKPFSPQSPRSPRVSGVLPVPSRRMREGEGERDREICAESRRAATTHSNAHLVCCESSSGLFLLDLLAFPEFCQFLLGNLRQVGAHLELLERRLDGVARRERLARVQRHTVELIQQNRATCRQRTSGSGEGFAFTNFSDTPSVHVFGVVGTKV
jgi:hypothetical protein